MLEKGFAKDKIRVLFIFLEEYIRFRNPEINAKFDTELNLLTNKHATMGIEEFVLERERKKAREAGENKVKTDVVKKLLLKKKLSIEEIASTVNMSVSFVLKIKAAMK